MSTKFNNMLMTGGAFNFAGGDIHLGKSATDKGIDRLFLNVAPGAFHDSGERFDPPKSHHNTRVAVIQEILDWLDDLESSELVMWLYGATGAGKSVIAQTIAQILFEQGRLSGSFFFARGSNTGRGDEKRLVPTLAYQLAKFFPSETRVHISAAVLSDPSIFHLTIFSQVQSLLVNPLRIASNAISSSSKASPRLLIIDGLDDCRDADVQCHILQVFTAAVKSMQHHLPQKLLIASRSEIHLSASFNELNTAVVCRRLPLDNFYKDIEAKRKAEEAEQKEAAARREEAANRSSPLTCREDAEVIGEEEAKGCAASFDARETEPLHRGRNSTVTDENDSDEAGNDGSSEEAKRFRDLEAKLQKLEEEKKEAEYELNRTKIELQQLVDKVAKEDEERRKEDGRKEEEARKREEAAQRREEEIRRREEAAKMEEAKREQNVKEEAVKREGAMRMAEELIRKRGKTKQAVDQLQEDTERTKDMQLEAQKIAEDALKRQEDLARKKDMELKEREDILRQLEELACRETGNFRGEAKGKRKEETRPRQNKEEAMKERAKEGARKREESKLMEEQAAFHKSEEDIRRTREELKRNDSFGNDNAWQNPSYLSPIFRTSSVTSWTPQFNGTPIPERSTSATIRGDESAWGPPINPTAFSSLTANPSSVSASTGKPRTGFVSSGTYPKSSSSRTASFSEAERIRKQQEFAESQQAFIDPPSPRTASPRRPIRPPSPPPSISICPPSPRPPSPLMPVRPPSPSPSISIRPPSPPPSISVRPSSPPPPISIRPPSPRRPARASSPPPMTPASRSHSRRNIFIPPPTPPPASYDIRIRRGYWNRRGDHLTREGYIVYAPTDKAYPAELITYPSETEGYQDENGIYTKYIARPELPESTPRHGKPPECPYEMFVTYGYL